MVRRICILFLFLLPAAFSKAQDTTIAPSAVLIDIDSSKTQPVIDSTTNFNQLPVNADSINIKKHDPKKATIRSAIIPGWGQAYNREYWKIPIVYGALSIPAITFFYNNKWYKKTRDAYNIVVNQETNRYNEIDPKLFDKNGKPLDAVSLQFYRNQFRQDRDYSVLYFLGVWAVQVVDATVFGHLKEFDVSDDLSMKINPGYDPVFGKPTIGFALNFKNKKTKSALLY